MGTISGRRQTHHVHHDRDIEEVVHDPYRSKAKPSGNAFCPDCFAVFQHGRWAWGARAQDAKETVCPACLRARNADPAGTVAIGGPFFEQHADELLHLVDNIEERSRAEHPLERIMSKDIVEGRTVFSTTDIHLARRIGEALYRAYHGNLTVKYSPDEYRVRVQWER